MDLHALWLLFLVFYPFFGNRNTDKYFLLMLEILIIHWIIFKNECVVSYLKKRQADPSYVMGSDVKTRDLEEYFGKNVYTTFRWLKVVSFIYVYMRYNKYKINSELFTFAALLLFMTDGKLDGIGRLALIPLYVYAFHCPSCPLNINN